MLGVTAAAAVSFFISSIILRRDKSQSLDLSESQAQVQVTKNEASTINSTKNKSVDVTISESNDIKKIIFACDAGMGSSAMGASILRDKIKKAGLGQSVTNTAISNLRDEPGLLVVTQKELADRALKKTPNAIHIAVDNFLNSPKYDQIIADLKTKEVVETDQQNKASRENHNNFNFINFDLVQEVVFVHHDQNVGSATMAMGTFRKALRNANKKMPVYNLSVGELKDKSNVLVIASKETAKRLKTQFSDLQIIVVSNLLNDEEYGKIISQLD